MNNEKLQALRKESGMRLEKHLEKMSEHKFSQGEIFDLVSSYVCHDLCCKILNRELREEEPEQSPHHGKSSAYTGHQSDWAALFWEEIDGASKKYEHYLHSKDSKLLEMAKDECRHAEYYFLKGVSEGHFTEDHKAGMLKALDECKSELYSGHEGK